MRESGALANAMSEVSLSPESKACLTRAGWREGNPVDTRLTIDGLELLGQHVHAAARSFLGEFCFLYVRDRSSAIAALQRGFHFDALVVARGMPREELERLEPYCGSSLNVIGETSARGDIDTLVMASDGQVFAIFEGDIGEDHVDRVGVCGKDAINALCEGRQWTRIVGNIRL
jgi:hypothetical protein